MNPTMVALKCVYGVGKLVGRVPGPGGHLVAYRTFVAPGLLAVAAMNGAVLDTTLADVAISSSSPRRWTR